ncbi:MAG TPA: nitrite reductase large subunit NirB [Solirubrobacterales bacterium]|nr:nitrite reductase large subunit NirB [Solirubrobacterales bacterium]
MFRSRELSLAIVGGGIAAQCLCEEVLKRDPGVNVTMVCAEEQPPYDRVRLSELLLGDDGPEALALRPPEWYEDHRVELLLGTRVDALDAAAPALLLANGEERHFDEVALATGSQPLLPPIEGIDKPGVACFRDPEDCDWIRAQARPGARAVVIGGGLLGLEAARGLVARGMRTTVVHLVDRLMERQLDRDAAAMLLPAIEELGVEVLLERDTVGVLGTERAEGLRFGDGSTLAAEMVVVSVGIRPEIDLARAAGLEWARGIVVDDRLRTSAENVVALGECAEHDGVVHGLVAPIAQQARVAAETLLDLPGEPYRGSVQWAKLKVAGIDLVAIGRHSGDAAAVDRSATTYRKLVVEGGRIAGAVLLGDTRGAEDLLAAVEAGEESAEPLARLAAAATASAADLPDSAQVCNCNGVCKGDLLAAVRERGLATAREAMAVTRAGTGCGSCRGMVKEIVAAETGGTEEPAYLCPCRRQTREELAARIREDGLRSVSEVSGACGTGRECGACKPALAYLVSEINQNRHREERGAKFINDRVHANIQRDGSFSVVPRMYGGVTTPEELRRIADVAERYEVKMVKVTGGQRIDLLGVRKADLPQIWRDLDMPSGFAYSKAVRTVKSCVGSDFCRFGIGDSIALAQRIEREWEGVHTPHKVKAGVSGCPRNCAEATVKDIGVVAVEGGWQVRVGGAAGANVREADVLCTVETADEVLAVGTAFLQYYREHGQFKERIYDFLPRVGLEQVEEAIFDPERAAALRERFRIARAAAGDAWRERDRPYHANQFGDLGEVEDPAAAALVGPPADGGIE